MKFSLHKCKIVPKPFTGKEPFSFGEMYCSAIQDRLFSKELNKYVPLLRLVNLSEQKFEIFEKVLFNPIFEPKFKNGKLLDQEDGFIMIPFESDVNSFDSFRSIFNCSLVYIQ